MGMSFQNSRRTNEISDGTLVPTHDQRAQGMCLFQTLPHKPIRINGDRPKLLRKELLKVI